MTTAGNSPITVSNNNLVQFIHLEGRVKDQKVDLEQPARKIVAQIAGGVQPAYVFCFISFEKLSLLAPVPIGQLKTNELNGFCLGIYAPQTPSGPQGLVANPLVKLHCPITRFFVNMWGISASDGSVTDAAMTLLCSDNLDEIVQYPTPTVLVG